jgi:hypothetical protein
MTDDFSNLRQDEDQEEIPDWTEQGGDDAFDQLRRKSARTGAMHDEMAEDEEFFESSSSLSFSLGNFTPTQRLILAVLILLDVLAVGFGLLVITGVI